MRNVFPAACAGRCVILSCSGQRTMRTCLEDAERLSGTDIGEADFAGAKWVFLSGYILYRWRCPPSSCILSVRLMRAPIP